MSEWATGYRTALIDMAVLGVVMALIRFFFGTFP